MISKHINPQGDSIVSVFINRGTITESEQYFKALSGKLTDQFYPDIVGYMEKIKVNEQADKCKTIEDLEALRFNYLPDDLFTSLAAVLDKNKDLKDSERFFLLARIGDALVGGAYNYVKQTLYQRAQAIARAPKSRIIL